jgi:putative Mg2+ transporter-C (MgtC) family protein
MISEPQIIIRLLVAAALGLVIGYERERQDHPAGMRTHMILVLGSTLAMCLSINLAIQFHPAAPNGDPSRLAAQVVSGIGFLGAGAILRMGVNIKGLTTATSLWTMAIVGLAVGAGLFLTSIVTTVFLLVILTILNQIEKKAIFSYELMEMEILTNDREGIVEEIKALLVLEKHKISNLCIEKDLDAHTILINAHIRVPKKEDTNQVANIMAKVSGVRRVKISD